MPITCTAGGQTFYSARAQWHVTLHLIRMTVKFVFQLLVQGCSAWRQSDNLEGHLTIHKLFGRHRRAREYPKRAWNLVWIQINLAGLVQAMISPNYNILLDGLLYLIEYDDPIWHYKISLKKKNSAVKTIT